jgi:hypothetical protein
MVYDEAERRVYCTDCEQDVDTFDAFMRLVYQQDTAWRQIKRAREEVREAQDATLLSRAAKAMDRYWRSRKTVPNCPHCNEALLPEDVTGNRLTTSSKELARRRREKQNTR